MSIYTLETTAKFTLRKGPKMSFVNIHTSGQGSEKLAVDSYYNGLAYNFSFGEAGSPMRNVYLQGDDAAYTRERFDHWEAKSPDKPTREIWLTLIDDYL